VAVRSLHLTDDELWRAIADNTNALSALIEKQCEWDAELEAPAIVRTLKSISICRADKYHREYEDYIAEVCRRYPTIQSPTEDGEWLPYERAVA
jgi:hypothetical protein